jgi:acetyl esterase/lipase
MLLAMDFSRLPILALAVAALLVPLAPAQVTSTANAAGSLVGTVPPSGYASVETLWPGGAPDALGTTFDDVPKLYCYPAAGDGPHSAVVVLPGGGYTHLVMDKEGGAEARWLAAHGVSAYVLVYRLSPRYMYPSELLDGMRAVRYVRAHAAAWHLRPDALGVWGFSAGGHMAGFLATADPHGDPSILPGQIVQHAELIDPIDRLSAHPDFAILSYGRVDLDPTIPGTFGMKAITGPDATQSLTDAIDPIQHVTAQSSPTFIYSTEYDEKVNSMNATHFFDALHKAGVSAELHVFEQGPHGTHMGDDQPRFPELAVTPLLIQHWLQLHGWMP